MVAEKFLASLVGIALGVAAAAAIARSPAQTAIGAISKTTPFAAAVCPKIEWPYGCDWRPGPPPKHLSMHRNNHIRSSLSFFR